MLPTFAEPKMRAWIVVAAGTAVNLCLGILYAWSVWKANLVGNELHPAGSAMEGINEGWTYLTDAQGTWAYALCGFLFALAMIPGGRIQDRFGPRTGAILGGVFLASGCLLAGLMKSYLGLVLGFGILGGIGMGFGYAAATPAAVKWFGPHQRGLIVGIVVGGFGAAAMYVSPLAKYLIGSFGLTGSFLALGGLFAVVIIFAGSLLRWPPADHVPPSPPPGFGSGQTMTRSSWAPTEMLRSFQFYALVLLFLGAAQSGLLVIANASSLLGSAASESQFLRENAWLLPAFLGLVNAMGRVGTGFYSDLIGRRNAYLLNGTISAAVLFSLPTILDSRSIPLLFAAVGVAAWQYGGSLSLMPAYTADFFGAKNLGINYGLVFLGWGAAFFIPQIAGYMKDAYKSLSPAFYLSASLLTAAVVLCLVLRRPIRGDEMRSE
jgi:OFA family oxalate/formate antiporter-like MFS transporter